MDLTKRILSIGLAAIAASSYAAKIEIRFESATEREVWVLDDTPDRMPLAGRAFNSKSIPIEVDGDSKVIVVHEPKTSSVAIRRAGDIEGTWTVDTKEWRAAEVTVKAFTRGRPLPSGKIGLHTPSFTKTMPVENGEAKFFAVPYGDVEVRVDYKNGGIPPTAPQIFRISKEADAAERTIGVTVVEGPDVPATTDGTESEQAAQSAPTWYARLLVWLVSLALAGVALVFLLRFLKDRSDVVEEKLKGLGVPIPGDLAQSQPDDPPSAQEPFEATPVVPAGHCAYCGKEQSECVCRLDAPKVSAAVREPEFVGLGVELRIPEGESIVGREGDLVVSDPTVSRQHARVTREDDTVTVEDLGSSNGTFVDGVRIDEPTVVKPGATVHFGSVKVRLEG